LTVIVRPMMFGSLPNRNCQARWLITASASAREPSSTGVKPRPSERPVPTVEK
jgi:hypothetical protein